MQFLASCSQRYCGTVSSACIEEGGFCCRVKEEDCVALMGMGYDALWI